MAYANIDKAKTSDSETFNFDNVSIGGTNINGTIKITGNKTEQKRSVQETYSIDANIKVEENSQTVNVSYKAKAESFDLTSGIKGLKTISASADIDGKKVRK